MERSAPYALIGLFVLLGLAAGAGLLVWLTDYDPGRRTSTYAVVFEDVSGLGLASEVRYNGLPVGEVARMELDPAGTGLIRVEIEVLEEVPLRRGSVARLSAQGVTGVAVVALEGGDPRAEPIPEGPDGVPLLAAGRGAVETLADEGPALLEEARALVADLRAFATPENAQRVGRVLADLERGAAGLGEVGTLAEDLGGIGRDLAPALGRLPQTLARVEGAATEAEALAAALRVVVDERAPSLAVSAETALSGIAEAATLGTARLAEAGTALAAMQDAADGIARLAVAGTEASEGLRDLARQAEPAVERASSLAATLDAALPPILTDAAAVAAAARPFAQDRLPALADRAQTALAGVEGVMELGRARLVEAEPMLGAATEAADAVAALSTEARGVIASAGDALDGIHPLLADTGAAARSLREDVPPLLESIRTSAEAVQAIAAERLPVLAEDAQAALQASTRAAASLEAQATDVGIAARARLQDGEAALEAFSGAARAVSAASAEVEGVLGTVVPAVEDIAAAGTHLAASAEVVGGQVEPLVEDARGLIGDARAATGAARAAFARADGALADWGQAATGVGRTMREVTEAAEAVRRLAQRLARDPSSLLLGR